MAASTAAARHVGAENDSACASVGAGPIRPRRPTARSAARHRPGKRPCEYRRPESVSSSSSKLLVLAILAVVWGAALIPPLLRSRSELRTNSSVNSFRRTLADMSQI